MVTSAPEARVDAGVKTTTTFLPVAPGRRSAAAMVIETAVTWPPSGPEETPTLVASLTGPELCDDVPTLTPSIFAEVSPTAAPITALVSVTDVEPALRVPAKVSVTVVEVPAFNTGVTVEEPHVPAGVGVTTAVVMKPGGRVMVTLSLLTRSVAVLKPMTILPVAPGVRVAGVKVTAVTWPPRLPDATPEPKPAELTTSLTAFPEAPALEGPTLTPVHEPAVWAPITAPVNVRIVEPALKFAPKTTLTVVTPLPVTGVIAV